MTSRILTTVGSIAMLKHFRLGLCCSPKFRPIFLISSHTSRFHTKHSLVSRSKDLLDNKLDSFKIGLTFPEKYRGTIVEKWFVYWKDLLRDYGDVVKETLENAKKKPKKTTLMLSLFGFIAFCVKNNPDEVSFRNILVACGNEILLVGKPIRSPVAEKHLTFIESCYNVGVLRRLSFGAFSIMWIDNYDQALGLYKSRCSYLKPRLLSFHERIIDIGFLSKWWLLDNKMEEFDVNPEEWSVKTA